MLNARSVRHAAEELYEGTKRNILERLDSSRVDGAASFAMVTDVWSCERTDAKFVGVRVYMVGADWTPSSVLLGVRRFTSSLYERDLGIRRPMKRWITSILREFALKPTDLFGTTTRSDADVKHVMRYGIHLTWEGCIPYLLSASIKSACGIVKSPLRSKNPDASALLYRVMDTVRTVARTETVTFQDLCKLMDESDGLSLQSFRPHHFLCFERAVQCILRRWVPLVEWFKTAQGEASHDDSALESFPLVNDKPQLTQMMCLLRPIFELIRQSQADTADQVAVLVSLYKLRRTVLDPTVALVEDGVEALSPQDETDVVSRTRALLSDAFQKSFFSRYTEEIRFGDHSYSFELQMMLHPKYKGMDLLALTVRFCNAARGIGADRCSAIVDQLTSILRCKLASLMMQFAGPTRVLGYASGGSAYFEEKSGMFRVLSTRSSLASPVRVVRPSVTVELDEWLASGLTLSTRPDGTEGSVLEFWRDQESAGRFEYLPKVAKILFALPASAAQVERDFKASGLESSSLQTNVHEATLCSFIKSNSAFVDVETCPGLSDEVDDDVVPVSTPVSAGSIEEGSIVEDAGDSEFLDDFSDDDSYGDGF